jgi:HTH-type transcriptional regulator / antitoxin HigA
MPSRSSIIVQFDKKSNLPVDVSACNRLNYGLKMVENADYRTPGQLIQALLDARGWSQRVLAVVLKADETGINKILSGKRPVDAEMALALSRIFSVAPERFLELQKSYELAQARLLFMDDPEMETRAQLFGALPVADMIRRGWLDADDVKNFPKVEAAIAKFYGVNSVREIEVFPHAAKKTNVFTPATHTQIAWLYRVREIASEMLVGRYSERAVESAIPRLKDLLISAAAIRKVPRILAECGIRFVIVETLPGAKIDGVCFWLSDEKPVIGMSLRFDRIDNFWFVLRHELEHVVRLHGRDAAMLDVDLEGDRAGVGADVPDEERVANQAAADFCVPKKSLESFIARKSPFFYDHDIIGFSRTMQVHPGLVAGQLHHKLGLYKRFNNHLIKVRSIVAPSATVDGWGNVVPVG